MATYIGLIAFGALVGVFGTLIGAGGGFILAPVLNRTGLGGNPYVLLAVAVLIAFQLLFTYLPTLQGLFGTTALAPGAWVAVFVVSSSVLWLVELEKFIVRRRLRETGSRTQRLK